MAKRIITTFLVVVIVFSLLAPISFAVSAPMDSIQYVLTEFGNLLFPKSLYATDYLDWLLDGRSGDDVCPANPNGLGHVWQSDIVAGSLTGFFQEKCEFCGMYATDYIAQLEADKLSTLDITVYSNNLYINYPLQTESVSIAANSPSLDSFTFQSYDVNSLSFAFLGVVNATSSTYFSWTSKRFSVPISGTYIIHLSVQDFAENMKFWSYSGSGQSWSPYGYRVYDAAGDVVQDVSDGIGTIGWFYSDYDITISLNSAYTYEFLLPKFVAKAQVGQVSSFSCLAPYIENYYIGDIVQGSGQDYSAASRPASLMQTINNYNIDNSITDNSTHINYYIGTLDASNNITNVYSPNLFDEDTLVFTEPASGVQYTCVGWKYYYDQRAYVLELADNSMSYDGTDIKYLVLMYGDDNVTVAGYSSETTPDNLDFVFSDSYAYVVATGSSSDSGGSGSGADDSGDSGTDDSGDSTGTGFWDRLKNAFEDALASLIEKVLEFITSVLGMVLDLAYDLLSFFFGFLTDTVLAGIGNFFAAFADGSLFGFFQQENEDGTTTVALPEGVSGVFAFMSGVILALPWELRSLLIFGIAALVLLAVFKMAK